MSKDKFVFNWKIGDEVESKSSGEVSVISNECFSSPSRRYKPYGEAKKRYKAEKLAFQQSRMKKGDWVKDLVSGDKYQLQLVSKRSGAFGDKEMPSLKNLKPCKPPKGVDSQVTISIISSDELIDIDAFKKRFRESNEEPKLESENFKIENGELFWLHFDGYVKWGQVDQFGHDQDMYEPEIVNNACGVLGSNDLREIANLLDRSTAKRRS